MTKSDAPNVEAATSGDAQSEIDQILNEVEALRRELGADEPAEPSTAAIPATEEADLASVMGGASDLSAEDDELLKEFHASFANGGGDSSDGGMEDTLSELSSDDGESSGKSLLDQTLEMVEAELGSATRVIEAELGSATRVIDAERGAAAAAPSSVAVAAPANESEPAPVIMKTAEPAPVRPLLREVDAPAPTADVAEKAAPMAQSNHSSTEASPGSLTMVLSGNMTMKLKYEFDGQEVMVGFEDSCLKISLANGIEFKIPVGARALAHGNKAA